MGNGGKEAEKQPLKTKEGKELLKKKKKKRERKNISGWGQNC